MAIFFSVYLDASMHTKEQSQKLKWGKEHILIGLLQEMGPDPTQAYFSHTINKRSIHLWSEYFLTRPKEIFFTWREKIENLTFFREIF